MQTRLLFSIFAIFTCILLFTLIRNYITAMNFYELPKINPYELVKPNDVRFKPPYPEWLDYLDDTNREFIYPAPELQVKLLYADEATNKNVKKVFRVSVGVIDDYQFFCINQVFSAHNIQYSYYKIGENIQLVVVTNDEKYLHKVLDQLKRYAINYTLLNI